MIGRNSMLVQNKFLLYKQIIKPVWTYGIQLWGCSANSNIKIIRMFQNKILRDIIKAPWYCRNSNIHRDLAMTTITKEKILAAKKHKERLSKHQNRLASRFLQTEGKLRHLKRTKPTDLMQTWIIFHLCDLLDFQNCRSLYCNAAQLMFILL